MDKNLISFFFFLLECVIYIAIDDDDIEYASVNWTMIFPNYDTVVSTFPATKPAEIMKMVNVMAKLAFERTAPRCEYFVLLGDDVDIRPRRTWMQHVHAAFQKRKVTGFGVIAISDVSMSGFPSFPIMGRRHLEIFDGEFCPREFVNQDADPYIFELYRPFSVAEFVDGVELRNAIGGDELHSARYERVHIDWKKDILANGQERVRKWLKTQSLSVEEVITLDVVVPSFRTPLPLLRRIITLSIPHGFSTQFIIIFDESSQMAHKMRAVLEEEFGHRVRVRVNYQNLGASATRNHGLDEVRRL
jgi:hypothetical protein